MRNRNEYHKKYYLENKERIKEYNKRWKEQHREEYLKYHKERHKKLQQTEGYRDKRKKQYKNWALRNKKHLSKKARDYRKNNPFIKERDKLRHFALMKLKENIIKERKKCEKCGTTENLEIHHRNYQSNELNNLVLLCHNCHIKEHHT